MEGRCPLISPILGLNCDLQAKTRHLVSKGETFSRDSSKSRQMLFSVQTSCNEPAPGDSGPSSQTLFAHHVTLTWIMDQDPKRLSDLINTSPPQADRSFNQEPRQKKKRVLRPTDLSPVSTRTMLGVDKEEFGLVISE